MLGDETEMETLGEVLGVPLNNIGHSVLLELGEELGEPETESESNGGKQTAGMSAIAEKLVWHSKNMAALPRKSVARKSGDDCAKSEGNTAREFSAKTAKASAGVPLKRPEGKEVKALIQRCKL